MEDQQKTNMQSINQSTELLNVKSNNHPSTNQSINQSIDEEKSKLFKVHMRSFRRWKVNVPQSSNIVGDGVRHSDSSIDGLMFAE